MIVCLYYYLLFRRIWFSYWLRRLSELLDISYGLTTTRTIQLLRTSITIGAVCYGFIMVITFKSLVGEPTAFKRLTGIDLDLYCDLYRDLTPIWDQMENDRLDRPGRKRAIGAGRKYNLDMQLQLLMLLIHQHLRLTTEATGKLFNVHKSTVSRNTRRMSHALRSFKDGWIDLRIPNHSRKNLDQLLCEQPDLEDLLCERFALETIQTQGRQEFLSKRSRASMRIESP